MKTACIYHSRDLDGWMSAAIVKEWFLEQHQNYIINGTHVARGGQTSHNIADDPRIDFIGFDYGYRVPDVDDYDQVIMCDISFHKDIMRTLFETKSKFIWLDHHSSAIKEMGSIIPMEFTEDHSVKHSACELTWQFFFPDVKMPEIVRLLGRYDCFGHKGTAEEQTVLEFQYGARSIISNRDDAFFHLNKAMIDQKLFGWEMEILAKGREIYKYLKTEAKEIYSRAFHIEFIIMHSPTEGERYNFLCVNQVRFNPINFGIDYHADGYDGFACFHYDKGHWCFSLYNDNGEVDCSLICKAHGGGGHKGAAGFITDDINSIIK